MKPRSDKFAWIPVLLLSGCALMANSPRVDRGSCLLLRASLQQHTRVRVLR